MKNLLLLLTTILIYSGTLYGQPLEETVTDVDGNVYHTVKIGTQVWMVENLKTSNYRDGSEILNGNYADPWNGIAIGAYCDYEGKDYHSALYGKLYNWAAAVDPRNIAPEGWHVPSDEEWNLLENYLISSSDTSQVANGVGGLLKKASEQWNTPNTGATNSTGFTAIPGGRRSNLGFYAYYGEKCYWWTSTSGTEIDAWFRSVHYNNSEITRSKFDKTGAMSIRCVKDN